MKIPRLALLGVAVLVLAGCSEISTQPDEVGLHYNNGVASSIYFKNCVGRGQQNFDSPGDDHYTYPAGQRTYKFNGEKDAETSPFVVTSKDNIRLTVDGILRFNVNTTCAVLRSFHENIGLKYKAYDNDSGNTSDGWTNMLNDYLGTAVKRAMQLAASEFNWQDLYLNNSIRNTFESAVAQALPKYVTGLAGTSGNPKDEYFQNFSLTLQQPQPPQQLLDQIQQQQVAAQQANTINAQQAATDARVKQIQELVAVLGPYGYILYQNQQDCQNGNKDACAKVLPVPAGANINLNPGG